MPPMEAPQTCACALPTADGAAGPSRLGGVAEVAVTHAAWTPAGRLEWFDDDLDAGGGGRLRGTACLTYAPLDARATRLQLEASAVHAADAPMDSAVALDRRVILSAQLGY